MAVTAESVYGDANVVMEGTTIDGTNADDSMTYYTVDADENYEFQMIEPDPVNRTNTGRVDLHAVLPWDFYYRRHHRTLTSTCTRMATSR